MNRNHNSFYREMYLWFEDHYFFSAAGHVTAIERYYTALEKFKRIIVSHDQDGNGVILLGKDRRKVTCDLDDRDTILFLLKEGIKSELSRAKQEKDYSIGRLKEYVRRSYGSSSTDEEKEAIIRIKMILKYENN